MKIEKVNDNQIRCTLTKEDLASRQLKISELAYGTEKAKNLFRDMMQQANFEFGFEAEDIPLMIEAIPMNAECIVLIITKVEDPEELDTRFARFAPSVHEDSEMDEEEMDTQAANEVMDLFHKIYEGEKPAEEAAGAPEAEPADGMDNTPVYRMFCFHSMHTLLSMADKLKVPFTGTSSLYKNSQDASYLLLLCGLPNAASEYNKLCNMISEYASPKRVFPTTPSYLKEHAEALIPSNALQVLADLSQNK